MKPITGSIVALVTPMHADGSVDGGALKRLLDWHIAEGTNVIGVAGTTGEAPALGEDYLAVVQAVVDHVAGRIPVLAGAGGSDTRAVQRLAKDCAAAGADAILSVAPYYSKPSQAGMVAHFRAVADASPVPVMLYNVPSRTVADLQHDAVLELAAHTNIFGIKDASCSLERGAMLLRDAPHDFLLYSGDDATGPAMVCMGYRGIVSVTANVAPALMRQLIDACAQGDMPTVRRLQLALTPLHRQMFTEPSPAPAKWALSQLGLCAPHVRLPLLPLTEAAQAGVAAALRAAGIAP